MGQVATEEKSNEITAIPQLLEQIDLTDSLITIDAMGCQKEIACDIVDGGGDFVISVKDNQPKLKETIEAYFDKHLELDLEDLKYRCHETSESAHGRIDERSYFLTKIPPDFALKKEWPWIKAIGYSLRVTQHADGSETDETRYYILSRYLSGKRFSEAVRSHWAIESMHWVLDVTFREDDSRTRERTLGNNLSWLRRFAVGASQAPFGQRQPSRQDDPLHDEHGLPDGSPDYSMRSICWQPCVAARPLEFRNSGARASGGVLCFGLARVSPEDVS